MRGWPFMVQSLFLLEIPTIVWKPSSSSSSKNSSSHRRRHKNPITITTMILVLLIPPMRTRAASLPFITDCCDWNTSLFQICFPGFKCKNLAFFIIIAQVVAAVYMIPITTATTAASIKNISSSSSTRIIYSCPKSIFALVVSSHLHVILHPVKPLNFVTRPSTITE